MMVVVVVVVVVVQRSAGRLCCWRRCALPTIRTIPPYVGRSVRTFVVSDWGSFPLSGEKRRGCDAGTDDEPCRRWWWCCCCCSAWMGGPTTVKQQPNEANQRRCSFISDGAVVFRRKERIEGKGPSFFLCSCACVLTDVPPAVSSFCPDWT